MELPGHAPALAAVAFRREVDGREPANRGCGYCPNPAPPDPRGLIAAFSSARHRSSFATSSSVIAGCIGRFLKALFDYLQGIAQIETTEP
jgi:hypothetical protein